MKKNLFYKNIFYIRKKQQIFEAGVLKRSVTFNFLITTSNRNKAGFLINNYSICSRPLGASNSRSQCYLT
jgi:hypothetical protein